MRLIMNIASAIEEFCRSERGVFFDRLLSRTLVDRFWAPVRLIAYNPTTSIFTVLCLQLVFCVLYFPLYLCSIFMGIYGSILFFLLVIALAGRSLARTMSFPGSTASFQRDISTDFLRRLSMQLENIAISTGNFTASLVLIVNGRVPRIEIGTLFEKLKDLRIIAESLPKLSSWVKTAHAGLPRQHLHVSTDSAIEQLEVAIDAYVAGLIEFYPLVCAFLSQTTAMPSGSNVGMFSFPAPTSGPLNANSIKNASKYDVRQLRQKLLSSAARFLKRSEEMKLAAKAVRPKKDEDEGVWGYFRSFCNVNSGPSGLQRLSLPIMREQVKAGFGAEEIAIWGSDNNIIDAVYIPSRSRLHLKLAHTTAASGPSASQTPTPPGAQTAAHSFPVTTATVPPTAPGSFSFLLSAAAAKGVAARVALGKEEEGRGGGGRNEEDDDVSPIGTVFFLCPNAGMYECFAQAPRTSSWIGLYTSLGFDLCIFNYRGYSRSSGVPTPDRLKRDAESVMRYLLEEKRVKKLLIHGESIGGMIACHVAARCGCDLLVCDRTFASLDAVAGRLLGHWAGVGLRYLGMWHTNVVADYLAAKCHKVVLQDPHDEIIAHTGSLKAGVATNCVLGDAVWSKRKLSRRYRVALALGDRLPAPSIPLPSLGAADLPSSGGAGATTAATFCDTESNIHSMDASRPLSEDAMEHFFACILDVSNRVRILSRIKAAEDVLSSSHNGGSSSAAASSSMSGGGLMSPSASAVALSILQSPTRHRVSSDASRERERGKKRERDRDGGCQRHYHHQSTSQAHPLDEADTAHQSKTNVGAPSPRHLSDASSPDNSRIEAAPAELIGSRALKYVAKRGAKTRQALKSEASMDHAQYSENLKFQVSSSLDALCLRSIYDPTLHALEKVLLCVARIDGGCGQLLGQALQEELDGTRSWVCSLLLWAPRTFSEEEKYTIRGAVPLWQAVEELRTLVDVMHADELDDDESVKFIVAMLLLLNEKTLAVKQGANAGLVGLRSRPAPPSSAVCASDRADQSSLCSSAPGASDYPSSSSSSSSSYQSSRDVCRAEEDSVYCSHERDASCAHGISHTASRLDICDKLGLGFRFFTNMVFRDYGRNGNAPARLSSSTVTATTKSNHLLAQESEENEKSSPFDLEKKIGRLVTLRTGHNGWPSAAEIESIKQVITSAGFNVER